MNKIYIGIFTLSFSIASLGFADSSYKQACFTNQKRDLCEAVDSPAEECEIKKQIIESCKAFVNLQVLGALSEQKAKEKAEEQYRHEIRIRQWPPLIKPKESSVFIGFGQYETVYFYASAKQITNSTSKVIEIVKYQSSELQSATESITEDIKRATFGGNQEIRAKEAINALAGIQSNIGKLLTDYGDKLLQDEAIQVKAQDAAYNIQLSKTIKKLSSKDRYLSVVEHDLTRHNADQLNDVEAPKDSVYASIKTLKELKDFIIPKAISYYSEQKLLAENQLAETRIKEAAQNKRETLNRTKASAPTTNAALTSGNAHAPSVTTQNRGSYVKFMAPACRNEDDLKEIDSYIFSGDNDGISQLIYTGNCVMLHEGEGVSMVSVGFFLHTIRYKGTKLLVSNEAIQR